MRLNTSLFDRLATARGATSRAEAARLCGIDPSTISRHCAGSVEPDLSTAMQIARSLGVTVEALYSPAEPAA